MHGQGREGGMEANGEWVGSNERQVSTPLATAAAAADWAGEQQQGGLWLAQPQTGQDRTEANTSLMHRYRSSASRQIHAHTYSPPHSAQ